ncbi:MAG: hypothetical protein ACFKPT_07600 [Gloeotrichia echinulata GP01]
MESDEGEWGLGKKETHKGRGFDRPSKQKNSADKGRGWYCESYQSPIPLLNEQKR